MIVGECRFRKTDTQGVGFLGPSGDIHNQSLAVQVSQLLFISCWNLFNFRYLKSKSDSALVKNESPHVGSIYADNNPGENRSGTCSLVGSATPVTLPLGQVPLPDECAVTGRVVPLPLPLPLLLVAGSVESIQWEKASAAARRRYCWARWAMGQC